MKVDRLQQDYDIFIKTSELSDNLQILNLPSDQIKSYIEKRRSQIIDIFPSDFEQLKNMFTTFQIPWIVSYTEAEKYASQLCLEGKVIAVVSDDTDILAYQCPIAISNLNIYTGNCTVVNFDEIINQLGFTKTRWVDFCIMCGNDFNLNIPNLGASKSFKLLTLYKSIENIGRMTSIPIELLKYKRTREIFTIFLEDTVDQVPFCGSVTTKVLNDFVLSNKIIVVYDLIYFCIGNKIQINFI